MRKLSRSGCVKKADDAFSKFIRKRDISEYSRCPLCIVRKPGTEYREIEHCFHFISRRHFAVRWYEKNAIGSCSWCNMDMNHRPHIYLDWWQRKYGYDAWNDMLSMSREIVEYSNQDLLEIADKYKNIS